MQHALRKRPGSNPGPWGTKQSATGHHLNFGYLTANADSSFTPQMTLNTATGNVSCTGNVNWNRIYSTESSILGDKVVLIILIHVG